jgi:hypothetical protein
VLEYLFDDLIILDKGDGFHLAVVPGTYQRVHACIFWKPQTFHNTKNVTYAYGISIASLKKIASHPKQPRPPLVLPKPIYRQTSTACDIKKVAG